MKQDIIFIEALETEAIIGIYDWERASTQPLVFDIEMKTDLQKAVLSDDISDTICYATISEEVIELVKNSRYELVESLAEAICQQLLDKHKGINEIKLKLSKPMAVKETKTVGLIIHRTRNK